MPEPLGTPAALISSRAAGGVFSMNVNVRSSYTLISAGTMSPRWDSVCGVVRLEELHDVHAVLAERGADRRRRGGLARRQLQREGLDELLLLGGMALPGLG